MQFSGSRAISDTFQALKDQFGPMLGIWGIFFVIQIALIGLFAMVSGAGMAMMGDINSMEALSGGFFVGVFVLYLVYFYLSMASSASLTSAASPLTRSGFSEALGAGFRSGLPLMGVMLLLFVAYFVVALLFGLVVGVIGAVVGQDAAGLLALIIIVPGMAYLVTKVSLVLPVVAVDGERNPITAIRSAWRMSDGATLKMALLYLGFGAVVGILIGLLFVPMLGSVATAVAAGQEPGFAMMMGSLGYMLVGWAALGVAIALSFASLMAAIHSQLSDRSSDSVGETFA